MYIETEAGVQCVQRSVTALAGENRHIGTIPVIAISLPVLIPIDYKSGRTVFLTVDSSYMLGASDKLIA
jgi:hypothetical protein